MHNSENHRSYLARYVNGPHCLGRSTSTGKRTLLADLLLSQGDTYVGEQIGKDHWGDAACSNGFLGLVKGRENISNSLKDSHVRSIHTKAGEILGSPESSGKDNGLRRKLHIMNKKEDNTS